MDQSWIEKVKACYINLHCICVPSHYDDDNPISDEICSREIKHGVLDFKMLVFNQHYS